ncbi:MAG: hypothetical protein ABIU20_07275 [Blastocatellia bacterium]
MPVRLFVGNLPYNVTEAELREHFSAVGPVSYLSLPTDRETGQVRGFAFIEFNERAHAEDAVNRFNNQVFKGRPIAVSEARAREDRPPSGPSGGSVRPSTPRLTLPRSNEHAGPNTAAPPDPGGKRGRDFGPDASPHPQRNKKGGPRPERAQKGPMREMVRGRFFGGEDDVDDFDEDLDNFDEGTDDLHEEDSEENSSEKEAVEENLASPQNDVKGEDSK